MSSAHYELPPLPVATNPSRNTPAAQVSDVNLFDAADGGDVEIVNGVVTMSDGLQVAAYLSLFGGNAQDSGLQGDDRKQFWGNLSETDPARQYRSRTQNMLLSLPAIPANLLRLEDAAKSDLDAVFDSIASKVDVACTMPALNTVSIAVAITISDVVYQLSFLQQWGAKK